MQRKMVAMRPSLLALTATALSVFAACPSHAQEPGSAPETKAPCAADGKVPMRQANGQMSSPAAMSFAFFGDKVATVYYSSPGVRCRKVFGELEPFGKVWRLGANPSTTLVSQVPLKIGSVTVPAGTHTLYAIPEASGKKWTLIVNNAVGQWGTEYDQSKDLGRTEMMESTAATPQEHLNITFSKPQGKSSELHIRWDKADEWVKVEAQ